MAVVLGSTFLRAQARELRYGPTVDGPVITTTTVWDGGPDALVHGVLSERDGCLLLGTSPVFWMRGTHWDAAHHTVVFHGGRAALGSYVEGGGATSPVRDTAKVVEGAAATRLERCVRLTGAQGATVIMP